MTRHRGKRKSPSRERYEKEHPTISCRTDRESKRWLDEHRQKTGCSYLDLMLDTVKRDKSKAAEKRAEILAWMEIGQLDEARLMWIDELLFYTLLTLSENNLPALCPRCRRELDDAAPRLLRALGDEIRPNGERETEVPTWQCPRCGWVLDTFNCMESTSIRWDDPVAAKAAKAALKPRTPSKNGRKKQKYEGRDHV